MALNKVEICGVNTSRLPVLTKQACHHIWRLCANRWEDSYRCNQLCEQHSQ